MDKALLEKLYVEEKFSYREIAERTGVSSSSIYRWVKKFDLVGRRTNEIVDLTGQQFGQHKVISYVSSGRYPKGGVYHLWKCECVCGEIVNVRGGNLKNSINPKCKGCSSKELSEKLRQVPIDYQVWFRIVDRCKRKGIKLGVTAEYLWELYEKQEMRCALTGVPIIFGPRRNKSDTTASPDRIDSSLGYVEGNIQWVHKTVNSMKNVMSVEEFQDWCRLVCDFKTPA